METPRQRTEREPLSSINITPLVDVMLVLLIVFMVTASLGQQGINVHLPQAGAAPLKVSSDTVVVSIDSHLDTYINSTRVPESQLTARIEAINRSRSDKTVFLKSDETVPYGDFIKVVSLIKAAGVEQLGMITENPQR